MKIAPKAIESFLANPKSCPAILFYGPDGGLARERGRKMRELILGKDHDPFAFVELEESALLSDPARLSDELLAISMMAPKRLILIRDAGDKLAAIIRESAPNFNEAVTLVVLAGELSTRSGLRKWFEDDTNSAAIPCYHDEIRDVADLVRKSLSGAGIEADRDTIEYLSQQLGNDRFVTLQELEKIITFASKNKRLSLDEAELLVGYNRDSNMDEFVISVADKNLQAIDKMLQMQLREGVMPIIYLRSLQRYFNRLYFIKSQQRAGNDLESIIKSLKPKVFYKYEPSLKRHAQNWEAAQISKALALIVSAELACKTSDLPAIAASSRKLMQVTQVR